MLLLCMLVCAAGKLATSLVIEFLDFFELESSKAVFEVESSCVRNILYIIITLCMGRYAMLTCVNETKLNLSWHYMVGKFDMEFTLTIHTPTVKNIH